MGFAPSAWTQDWRNMDVVVFAFVHQTLLDPESVEAR